MSYEQQNEKTMRSEESTLNFTNPTTNSRAAVNQQVKDENLQEQKKQQIVQQKQSHNLERTGSYHNNSQSNCWYEKEIKLRHKPRRNERGMQTKKRANRQHLQRSEQQKQYNFW